MAGLGGLGVFGRRKESALPTLRNGAEIEPAGVSLTGGSACVSAGAAHAELRFAPFTRLRTLLDLVANCSCGYQAFAKGRSSPVRPCGGAGSLYAATAERAPPVWTFRDDFLGSFNLGSKGPTIFVCEQLSQGIGFAARFVAFDASIRGSSLAWIIGPLGDDAHKPERVKPARTRLHHLFGKNGMAARTITKRSKKGSSPEMSDLKKVWMLTAGALLATAVSASAAVVISSVGPSASNPPGGLNAPGFSAILPAGASSFGAVVRTGDQADCRSPFGGATAGNSYFCTNPGASGSPTTLAFSSLQSQLTMLWGSVDSYNTLEFYNGGALISTITGGQAVGNLALSGNSNISQIMTFLVTGGTNFNNVKFYSTQNAFEVAFVPLPAAGLLFVCALGGLGMVARRRKTAR